MTTDHLVDRLLAAGEVAVRNPRKFEDLCDSLDLRRIDYAVSRGRGGFHVKLAEPAKAEWQEG